MRGEFQAMFDELNVPITLDDIKRAVKQMRNGANAGPDFYINEFFKNGSDVLLNYIHTLFNKVFEV